jgi:ribosomal protein S18 acetylase RimI-like enzyme
MITPIFVPAARYSSTQLAALFTRGYEGYFVPIVLDTPTFEYIATLCDYDLEHSRVALVDGVATGFAVLAVRGARGWIGGMGVAPEARGHGLGAALMREVLAEARRLGLRSVDLECLTQNAPALRIYEALGFRRTRMLEVWGLEPRDVPAPALEVNPLDARECLAVYDTLHPARSPWQRDRGTLEHVLDKFKALGCSAGGRLQAWLLYRVGGDRINIADLVSIPQDNERRFDAMLGALLREHPEHEVRLLNLPEGDPAAPSLTRLGGRVDERQFEMTLAL